MSIEVRSVGVDRMQDFLVPILTALGVPPSPERADRLAHIPELETRLAAFDGESMVGAAGAFAFTLSAPGGKFVPTAGISAVGVLATHRRRGILRRLMTAALDDARARRQPIAALWASEASIYGRFGFGLASLAGDIDADRDRSAFVLPAPGVARARLVDEAVAMTILPRVWDAVRRQTPGMPSRSSRWWELRRIAENDITRAGRGVLQRVVFERDGEALGYALYRHNQRFEHGVALGSIDVAEAMGVTDAAMRDVWRYLFDIDLVQRIVAANLPVDHPLLLLASEPRRLRFRVGDALWVRVIDVAPALEARGYAFADTIVFDVIDTFSPSNAGRFRLDAARGTASRTGAPADLRLDVAALGSAYLSGFSFARLARVGRVEELVPGAIARADRVFACERAPYCPEIF